MKRYSLNKYEKLKSKKIIEAVFAQGKSVYKHPFKLYYISLHTKSGPSPAKIGFGVSKRNFKRAVDRNLIKRRMRECYRINKHIIYDGPQSTEKQYALMLVYTAKEIYSLDRMAPPIVNVLEQFQHKIKKEV